MNANTDLLIGVCILGIITISTIIIVMIISARENQKKGHITARRSNTNECFPPQECFPALSSTRLAKLINDTYLGMARSDNGEKFHVTNDEYRRDCFEFAMKNSKPLSSACIADALKGMNNLKLVVPEGCWLKIYEDHKNDLVWFDKLRYDTTGFGYDKYVQQHLIDRYKRDHDSK